MKNLAIIPARAGSKGLKDKNIKLLLDKPLLAYSVEAAIASGVFADVIVSTDSEVYKKIALDCGAQVPFLRSEDTASDIASSWSVVREVINKYADLNKTFDTVCLLQPTSPLRSAEDIVRAYDLFYEKSAKAVVSVCEAEHSPRLMNILDESLSMENFIDVKSQARRQDLGKYYRLNGAIYIVDVKTIMHMDNLYSEGSYAYEMTKRNSVDIDDIDDFDYAEYLIKKSKKE